MNSWKYLTLASFHPLVVYILEAPEFGNTENVSSEPSLQARSDTARAAYQGMGVTAWTRPQLWGRSQAQNHQDSHPLPTSPWNAQQLLHVQFCIHFFLLNFLGFCLGDKVPRPSL